LALCIGVLIMLFNRYTRTLIIGTRASRKNKGFSLLEIMIALLIMSVLLFGVAYTAQTARNFEQYTENKQYMNRVHDSLLTFVQVNGFLPCPDTNGDGTENRNLAVPACNDANGRLPFLDLGVAETDAWGQPIFYAVNRDTDNIGGTSDIASVGNSASYFNNQNAPVFGFNTPPVGNTLTGAAGNYSVCGERTPLNLAACATANVLIEGSAVAVVVSFGQNGATTWAGIVGGGNTNLANAEAENADNDLVFWLAEGSIVEKQEFDDQLFWLTGYDVKYAIIKSGRALQ